MEPESLLFPLKDRFPNGPDELQAEDFRPDDNATLAPVLNWPMKFKLTGIVAESSE